MKSSIWGVLFLLQSFVMFFDTAYMTRQFLSIESIIFLFLGGVFFTRFQIRAILFVIIGSIVLLSPVFTVINNIYSWLAWIYLSFGLILILMRVTKRKFFS